MKKSYERATIDVVVLKGQDVITTSGGLVAPDGAIYLPEDIF